MTPGLLLVVTLFAAGSAAQGPETIADVRVHGNQLTPADEIIRLSGLTIGAPFLPTTVAEITATLKASRRFDEVEVLKRFASITDSSRIVVVIIVNEGPVRIDVPGDGGPPRVVRRRGLRNLMFMPILDAEDGYGVTYGARLAVVRVGGPQGRLSFPLSWGGLKQVGVEFDRTFTSGPLSRVEVGGLVRRQQNPAFEEDDTRRQLRARAERQAGRFRFGGTAGWQRVSFAEVQDDLRTVGADVTFDTRRDPALPRNAVLAKAAWERIDISSGGVVHRTTLDGRAWVGLIGQTVLAVGARREHADRPQPAYLRSLLGGWSSLRGFKAGSFTGDTLVTGTLELIVPLTSALSVGKIGASAFLDAGAVQDHGARLRNARWRTGAGGSVWITLAAFRMNLAVARGRGGDTRVHFGGGFAF